MHLHVYFSESYTVVQTRVKSGLDDLGFLVGQVGLIRKLNYLDVTWISHVLCWHLVSE